MLPGGLAPQLSLILRRDCDRFPAFPRCLLLYCHNDPLGGDLSVLTQETVQIIAGALAVLLVGIIFLRRKAKKKHQEDEF